MTGMLAGTTGCSVHVDKSGSGDDRNVSIHTPFGGMEVRDSGMPADLGLALYPGSTPAPKNGKDSSNQADVRMGFGRWSLRVQVREMQTNDPQDKVVAFYRNDLARYGTVLTCHGNQAIDGSPQTTGLGLSCDDNEEVHTGGHVQDLKGDLELKAGSSHRQHIIAFSDKAKPATRYAMIALQLPESHDESSNAGKPE